MNSRLLQSLILFLLSLLLACSGMEQSEQQRVRKENAVTESVYRTSDEYQFLLPELKLRERKEYPWDHLLSGKHPKITKDFFRCQGSAVHAPLYFKEEDKWVRDCKGGMRHSLPLYHGQEFIYPALIDTLNMLQERTGQRVVITSGHCCPEHFQYSEHDSPFPNSKHMIGAEVDFYIQDMTENIEEIIEMIIAYFQERAQGRGDERGVLFRRYEGETDVAIQPWMNKEIFIKHYQAHEGRNIDNRHTYPYISLQVRYDVDRERSVTYTWEQAYKGYRKY